MASLNLMLLVKCSYTCTQRCFIFDFPLNSTICAKGHNTRSLLPQEVFIPFAAPLLVLLSLVTLPGLNQVVGFRPAQFLPCITCEPMFMELIHQFIILNADALFFNLVCPYAVSLGSQFCSIKRDVFNLRAEQ